MANTATDIGTSDRLGYLDEMTDYEVADGEPDVRGWKVQTPAGERIGTVTDLVVDTEQMKVRYLEVRLDANGGSSAAQDCTLVPIGAAQVRTEPDHVVVDVESNAVAGLPRNPQRQRPSRGHELAVVGCYRVGEGPSAAAPAADKARSDDEFYRSRHFDDSRFRGERERASAGGAYLSPRGKPRSDKPR